MDDYNDYVKNFRDNSIKLLDKYFQEEEEFKKELNVKQNFKFRKLKKNLKNIH
jgi:hypothetical protein